MAGSESIRKFANALCQSALWVSVICGFVWSVGAVFYLTLVPRWLTILLGAGVLASVGFLIYKRTKQAAIRQRLALIIICIYAVHVLQQPSSDRNWAEDNARMPQVQIRGDDVSVKDFRSRTYFGQNQSKIQYSPFNFRLGHIDKAWFVVQRFTAIEGIAHNFLSFRISDGDSTKYFCVSVEIRREVGEAFSPVAGLFRQYELIYVISDEQDQIGMRTVPRPDDRVYLYPVNATAKQLQLLFVDIASRANKLRESPEFYHSLLNNCTNNIVLHTYQLTPEPINWLDPRIVAPGYSDRVAFEWQLIGQKPETFEQLQKKSRIDKVARRSGFTDDFSERIRELVD